jgi:hypothetical protein
VGVCCCPRYAPPSPCSVTVTVTATTAATITPESTIVEIEGLKITAHSTVEDPVQSRRHGVKRKGAQQDPKKGADKKKPPADPSKEPGMIQKMVAAIVRNIKVRVVDVEVQYICRNRIKGTADVVLGIRLENIAAGAFNKQGAWQWLATTTTTINTTTAATVTVTATATATTTTTTTTNNNHK